MPLRRRWYEFRGLRWAAPLLFLLGVLMTALGAWRQDVANEAQVDASFDEVVDHTAAQLMERLRLYERGLRGVRGVVLAAGGPEITRQSFLAFTGARDFPTEFPGARAFAFVRRIRGEEAPALVAAMRAQGVHDFEIRDLGDGGAERFVVVQVAPLYRNEEAIGLDLASEPRRRAAAELARDTGEVIVTAPISLVQDDRPIPHGLLLLLPVYEAGARLWGPAERRAACFGWAAIPLVMDEILGEGALENEHLRIAVTDVTEPGTPLRLDGGALPSEGLYRRIELPVFGRRWALEARSTPAFDEHHHHLAPTTVLLLGAFVSALLAALAHFFILGVARQRQLFAHQRHLAAIVENSSDAILSETVDGVITSWNRAAERIFGITKDDALGRHCDELLRTEVDGVGVDEALASARVGVTLAPHDVRCRRSDGAKIDVSITLSPIVARDGKVSGVARMLRDISQHKEAERKLNEFNAELEREVQARTAELAGTSRHLLTVLDTVPAAIAYWDRDLINRFANATYARWVRCDPSGRHLRDVIVEPTYTSILPNVEAALRGETRRFEQVFGVVDGQPSHVFAHYIPDVVDGEARGFFVMVQDVTELHEGRTRLREILRGTDAGTWEWNLQTGELRVDERWAAILGERREDLDPVTVKTLLDRLHPDDYASADEARQRYFDGESDGIDIEARMRHRDGSWVWVHDCGRIASRSSDGRPVWIRGTRQDVTVRREAQRRLAENEAFLERVGHLARVGGWQLDVETQRLEWSRETRQIHEVPADYVPTVAAAVAFYADEARAAIASLVERATREGVGYDVELPLVTAKGRALWVRTICEVEFTGQGPTRGVKRLFGAFQDITRQREVEEALRSATRAAERASAAKSAFVANMSHEIRTPLHAILGIAHLLEGTTLDGDQRDFVAKVTLAGRNLLDVVNDILDLSKIEAGELSLVVEPFELQALLAEFEAVFGPAAAGKRLALSFELPKELPERVVGDANRLRQILTNLVGNAIKFTEKGRVDVRVEIESRTADRIRLRFIVRDTGIGVEPAALGQIFQPFVQADSSTTRRHGGTGLGLSIVERLSRLMEGEVSVTSEPGVGSEFRVSLPLVIPRAAGAEVERAGPRPRPKAVAAALAGVRILVVDDSEINREIACAFLAREGALVEGAADGFEGCERLAAEPEGFDVVLMDIQMPGMDGVEATRRIRGELGLVHLPVIALTAGTLRAAKERAYDAGIDDFLSKPLDPRTLIEKIACQVERARHELARDFVGAGQTG
ncbi:MAG: CHASE domain-containing protein [Nannocystaceae bacterium]